MGIVTTNKIKEHLRTIQPIVDKELEEMGLLNIIDGEKYYAFGSNKIKEEIQKRLLKEKYNVDWDGPEDNTIDIFY